MLYVDLFCGIGGTFYAAWIAIGPLVLLSTSVWRWPLFRWDCKASTCWACRYHRLRATHAWMAGLATSYGWTVGIAFDPRITRYGILEFMGPHESFAEYLQKREGVRSHVVG